MATGTAQTAVIGKTYHVGGEGWWGVSDTVLILPTDRVVVLDKDEVYVYVDVFREDALIGSKQINLCFFDEDFELAE
jgi:hypothetical protein